MTTQSIDPKLIQPNPFQPRLAMDPAKLAELAESIRTNGLLQPPAARRAGKGYELAFGHRRFAAWQMANPGQAFPCEVQDLTDQQMAEQAATENGQRDDLNPIERANGIRLLMDKFKLTQLQAGRFYGLTTQGAVANVLGLLKHPAEIQALVASGELSERQARDLRLVSRLNEKEAIKIARDAVKRSETERPLFLVREIEDVLSQRGKALRLAAFELDWPAEPIKVEKPNTVKGEPAELVSCVGCRFRYTLQHSDYCGNPPCFVLKNNLGSLAMLEKVSKKLGVPAAGTDETVTEIDIDYGNQAKMRDLVKRKHPTLRLIVGDVHNHYYSQEVTGTRFITLATTDESEVRRLEGRGGISVEMSNKAAAKASGKLPTAAELAKQKAAEEKEKAARRAAAAEFNRSKADTLWLVANVARTVSPKMELAGGIAALAFASIKHANQLLSEWGEAHGIISGFEKAGDYRAAIIAHLLSHDLFDGYGMSTQEHYAWARAQKITEKTITDKLKLKLADGWNKPPVHRTPANCWHCGVFSSNAAGVTKAEQAAGWEVTKSDITCPSCRRPASAADLASGKKKPKSSAELIMRDEAARAAAAAKKGKRLTEVFAQ
jgi:ParB/RepB/Spo0J family partition protein